MEKEFKMNWKRTILMGSAFFSILMLWQIYNTYCPVLLGDLLKETLKDANERYYIIGIIMAMDNLFALILVPVFGKLSDKTKTKWGKRKPYIVIGMAVSAIIFPFIAIFAYFNSLAGTIIFMGLTLIVMMIYRNPAVALMPDVTPKPIRATANGVINLIGYLGPIIGGLLAIIFKKEAGNISNIYPFIISSVFILVAMVIMIFLVNEAKWLDETREDVERGELYAATDEKILEDAPLSKANKTNLILILISIFFWFASFNAVETFLSTYFENLLGEANGVATVGTLVIIMTFSSIVTFIPGAWLSVKIGRKNSILIGIIVIITGLVLVLTQQARASTLQKATIVIYLAFVLAGVGWALINISSYPMIVEMSNKNNVGKFTGYYYTSSMIAQSVTPIAMGYIMTFKKDTANLFPYAIITMAIAFAIFSFVREKRVRASKTDTKKNFLEHFDVE